MPKKDDRIQQISEAILYIIDTSKNAISTLHVDKIMHHITNILPSIVGLDAAIVRLRMRRNPRLLSLEASTGIPKDISNDIKFVSLGLGFEGIAAKSRTHILIKDLAKETNTEYAPALSSCNMHSALCAPIIFDNDAYGTITVLSKAKNNYNERDVFVMRTFSNIVGIALKNAFLYMNLKESYLNTINSLVMIMESRDPYMRGHSERVTYVAIEIARHMNLSESDLHILRTAGKLHDIGKITISDSILSKVERLTPSDWAEIHLHPIRGVEIVMPLKFLESGLALIRNHHERYDGNGYPDGLIGESIPILARILSLADAFDAMTSKRPYRDPFTFERAVSEIKAHAGTQFDPDIVKIFVEIKDKIR